MRTAYKKLEAGEFLSPEEFDDALRTEPKRMLWALSEDCHYSALLTIESIPALWKFLQEHSSSRGAEMPTMSYRACPEGYTVSQLQDIYSALGLVAGSIVGSEGI